jgi:predicted NAD/FAD-binding protein
MDQNETPEQINWSSTAKRQICVIGAGISGLATAYYLKKLLGADVDIAVLEKEIPPGGNCSTFAVKMDNGQQRWADMGVNDYNKKTYKKLRQLMVEVGYIPNLFDANNRLEDQESFSTTDGSLCYTTDGGLDTPMSPKITADILKFQQNAYNDSQELKYAYYTLHDYVTEKGYSDEYIYDNLYPRVNGMYFCGGSPAEMPFRAVMSYYGLQEGYGGGGSPDRRYFRDGSLTWITYLMAKMSKIFGTSFFFNNRGPAKITPSAGRYIVEATNFLGTFDTVVMAVPADEAIKCFGGSEKVPPELLDILVQFQYITDESIVHRDARCLPPLQNSWRTYNINIFDSRNFNYGPYTITYVANRHQNDPENPKYNTNCENPQFFISCNPVVYPAAKSVMKQNDGTPARRTFRHQKLNINTTRAQQKLADIQGKDNIWFVNGFAKGAGLHEECLVLATEMAHRIAGIPSAEQHDYDFTPGAKQFAPDYLVNAHKEK